MALQRLRLAFQRLILWALQPTVDIHILPGGRMPERKSGGAVGYDAYLRAVVCPHQMDPADPQLRKPIFNFKDLPVDPMHRTHVEERINPETGKRALAWRINPREIWTIGIGFLTAMPWYPVAASKFWVAPRSGLASKNHLTVGNAPGTIDPDYRGEAGVVLINQKEEGGEPFYLFKDMRIVQIVFDWSVFPQFNSCKRRDQLSPTSRGAGGFGSTGLHR